MLCGALRVIGQLKSYRTAVRLLLLELGISKLSSAQL